MKVPAILKNKYVCYALMALASLNVIGYLTVKAWECLALFTLTAYSCYCYCNNVSCSILAALFVANFIFGCGRVKEGFEDAMKGPVEKMTEAATAAGQAQILCASADLSDPAQAEAACAAAKNAAGAACKYVAGTCNDTDMKTESTCIDKYTPENSTEETDRVWTAITPTCT